MILLHDKTFAPIISLKEIDFSGQNMARQVVSDFFEVTSFVSGVVNGWFMALSERMAHYPGSCEVNLLKKASNKRNAIRNTINHWSGVNKKLERRSVVLAQDNVATRAHIFELNQFLKHLKRAILFFKPEANKQRIGFDNIRIRIYNKFVTGYGLNFNGRGRN